MAKIVGLNAQYIKVAMKNGTFEVYSRDCIDWTPEIGQELGFMIDEDGNVFIDLKSNIPAGMEYVPEADKEPAPAKAAPAFRDTFPEDEEEEEEPAPKKKPKKQKPKYEDEYEDEEEDEDDYEGEGSLVAVILGLVLGIVAIAATFLLPSLKIVAIAAGALAVILGIVGFFRGSKKVLSIIAMVLGVFSVVLSLLLHGDGKALVNKPTPTPEPTPTIEVATPTPEVAAYTVSDTTFGAYGNYNGGTNVDAVITIKNTGTSPISLSSGKITVLDSEGNELGSDTNLTLCPKVIEPGAEGYVQSLSGGISLDEYFEAGDLKVECDLDVSEKTDAVKFTSGEGSYSVDGYGYPYISGNVINNTDSDADNVVVQCMFFDASGKPVGVTEGLIEYLPAGETVGFEVYGSDLPAALLGNGLERYDVYAIK